MCEEYKQNIPQLPREDFSVFYFIYPGIWWVSQLPPLIFQYTMYVLPYRVWNMYQLSFCSDSVYLGLSFLIGKTEKII